MSFGKSTHSQGVESSSLDNAIALQTAGWHHEALDIYNKILAVEPKNSVALVYGGVALLELGRVADAVTRLEDAAALFPGVADIHGYLANALLLAKKPEAAERHYLKAAELAPEDPTPPGNLGILLKDQDRLEEAMEQFRRAISIKNDYGPAYRNLCDCLRRMGRIDEAIDTGKRAILVDPDNAQAHNNLGVALADAGQVEDAIESYRKAVSFDPTAVDTLNNLSIALIIARQPHEALIVADNCLKSDPGNIQALATLSVALQEVGDQDRFKALLDYDLLTRRTMLDAPPDYGTLQEYNKALADHVRTHPTLAADPKGNATRAGRHSGDLLAEPAGPFDSFQSVIRNEVSAYIKSIPENSKHPYFAKIPAQFTIEIWGIVLTGEGHQIPHIHPDGWLSGCYYPAIPQGVSQTDPARSGWFEFGKPQPLYSARSKPDLHPICPREGLLLLFPSFIFHRTIPVQTTEERISIAFDVLPTGYSSP